SSSPSMLSSSGTGFGVYGIRCQLFASLSATLFESWPKSVNEPLYLSRLRCPRLGIRSTHRIRRCCTRSVPSMLGAMKLICTSPARRAFHKLHIFSARLIFRRLLRSVDQEHIGSGLRRLQLQPQLLFHCSKQTWHRRCVVLRIARLPACMK